MSESAHAFYDCVQLCNVTFIRVRLYKVTFIKPLNVYGYDGLCNVTFIQWTYLVILQLFCCFRGEMKSTFGTLYNCTFFNKVQC